MAINDRRRADQPEGPRLVPLKPHEEIRSLAHTSRKAAVHYEEKPGMAGAASIVDLYRTIARLCDEIDRLHTALTKGERDV
jgi:hypothetical protein